ncbi:MAG: GNAT family N-acetyltransferase [Thermoguttaceae bacterium]|jgi:protoporphyrinogen oxidase/ribosomal protein S18 acetylase RimI-like enzyme
MLVALASVDDSAAILDLQKLAYQSEAAIYDDFNLPPLTETLEALRSQFGSRVVLKAVDQGRIVGSVRGYQDGKTCHVGRLVVHPACRRQGIGTQLMNRIEASFGAAERFELFTGHRSATAIRLYERLGYRLFKQEPVHDRLILVFLEKRRPVESMMRPCNDADFDTIVSIINEAAEAYRDVIPADRWHEPYMSREELRHEIHSGVRFWGWQAAGELVGVMGIQDVQDVTLIRHAYVRTAKRNQGIGGNLLCRLRELTNRPVLIGTWAAATWAIRFYQKHGFRLVTPEEKNRLLKKYWSIPERQVETSVVLAGDGITRREFVGGALLGAAGVSAGALLAGTLRGATGGGPRARGDLPAVCHGLLRGSPRPAPPVAGPLYDCVVIGGGVSGLTAAWRLCKRQHHNLLLLEKNDSVGGYCRDERSGKQLYSIASAYTEYPAQQELVELYADLGVVSDTDADGNAVIAARYLPASTDAKDYIDGAWYDDAWDTGIDHLPLPRKVRDDLKAFRSELQQWDGYVGSDGREAFAKSTDQSTTDAKVRGLDRLTLKEYVARQGWDLRVSVFFDSFVRSSLGSTHDRISAWAAINFLLGEFNFRSGDKAPGAAPRPATNILTQPGGNGYLSRLLAQRVGAERIRTNAFVVRAKNSGDQVHVSFLESGKPRTVRARTAIYAAPRYLAPALLPDLNAEACQQARQFRYTPYLVANVHVSRTPGPPLWNGLVHGDFFVSDYCVADWPGLADPRQAPPARPNVLTVYAPLVLPGQRAELLATPAEDYEDRILADLERLLPGVRATVTGFDLYRWGHAMLAAEKGFVFSPARQNAARPVGRLLFANHDVEGLPSFENAVMSALRAARQAEALIAPPA